MLQKNVVVSNVDELKRMIPKLHPYSSLYIDGLIELFVGNIPEEDICETLKLLKSSFPKLKVVGMSSFAHVLFYQKKSVIVLNFITMEKSEITPFYKAIDTCGEDITHTACEYASELNKKIKSIKNVKAIELYFSKLRTCASQFLDILSDGLDDIPIFGVVASANSELLPKGYMINTQGDSFVIEGDSFAPGVSGVIYSGEELYIYQEYLFGWEPIGRYMEINDSDVSEATTTTLWKIDGQKATSVYKKYLGIGENAAFVHNISEFPLIVERNGIYMGRTPSAYGPNGEVYLEGDLRAGEKVRFSYGEHDVILNETQKAAYRMDRFAPERLSLVICGNRFNFFQHDYLLEAQYYSEGRLEPPNIILGMGEVYKYQGKGGIMNSVLVAVGMKENLGDETFSPIERPCAIQESEDMVPLSERLAHFLKAMTGELIESAQEAEAANKAKSRFLSNMSHEIRTPINAVLGMDEMILRESDQDNILEYAHNIRTAGNTLLSIVNDILDFSKIEAGKMDIIAVDYDFSSVINDLVHMIKPRAEASGLTLYTEISPDIPCMLNGDEIRLKQVITNILTNAVKYTKEGSVTLSISSSRLDDTAVDLIVSVKDTGIGIKKEDMNHLFNAFQRVDESRNRNIEGTGLGLEITRGLLKLMESDLKVKSEYGVGSEFYFTLRQGVVKWEPIGDYMMAYEKALLAKEKYHEKFTAPDARVLVVDDTPMNLTVFTGLLKSTRVHIDEAESGQECLEFTQAHKYDMIFLDHRMPLMDGIETLRRIRCDGNNPNNNTVIISLTANAVSGARERYIEAGFDDYMTKPIMSDKLEAMMLQYLPPDKITVQTEEFAESEADEDTTPIEWLQNIDGIDINAGLTNCGSKELYVKSVNTFMESADDNILIIKQFFEQKNIPDYTIKVHALKSSARIIGANELSKLAEQLEHAGDETDLETIENKTPLLLEKYQVLFTALKRAKGEPDESENNLPEIDDESFIEAVNSISELAKNFDYDSIRYIIANIDNYRVPSGRKDFYNKLKKAFSNADWAELCRIIEHPDDP
ncbi:Signal transduction histidine kinase [Lachnospiraceae bacterium]|nr:Signal transduction histidine kinase [Lachnospiraceae bacterium]